MILAGILYIIPSFTLIPHVPSLNHSDGEETLATETVLQGGRFIGSIALSIPESINIVEHPVSSILLSNANSPVHSCESGLKDVVFISVTNVCQCTDTEGIPSVRKCTHTTETYSVPQCGSISDGVLCLAFCIDQKSLI